MEENAVSAEHEHADPIVEAPSALPTHLYVAVEHTEDAVAIEVCSSLDEGLRVLVDRIPPAEYARWVAALGEEERSALPADVSSANTPEARRAVLTSYWGDPVEDGPERVEYGAGTGAAVYVERREVDLG